MKLLRAALVFQIWLNKRRAFACKNKFHCSIFLRDTEPLKKSLCRQMHRKANQLITALANSRVVLSNSHSRAVAAETSQVFDIGEPSYQKTGALKIKLKKKIKVYQGLLNFNIRDCYHSVRASSDSVFKHLYTCAGSSESKVQSITEEDYSNLNYISKHYCRVNLDDHVLHVSVGSESNDLEGSYTNLKRCLENSPLSFKETSKYNFESRKPHPFVSW